jgi:hypothetical protein
MSWNDEHSRALESIQKACEAECGDNSIHLDIAARARADEQAKTVTEIVMWLQGLSKARLNPEGWLVLRDYGLQGVPGIAWIRIAEAIRIGEWKGK